MVITQLKILVCKTSSDTVIFSYFLLSYKMQTENVEWIATFNLSINKSGYHSVIKTDKGQRNTAFFLYFNFDSSTRPVSGNGYLKTCNCWLKDLNNWVLLMWQVSITSATNTVPYWQVTVETVNGFSVLWQNTVDIFNTISYTTVKMWKNTNVLLKQMDMTECPCCVFKMMWKD